MARKRKLLPAIGLLLVTGSFLSIIWATEKYLLVEKPEPSLLHSALADFQADRPHEIQPNTIGNEDQDDIYARDVLCGGCYHSVANPNENLRCGLLIARLMKERSLSLADAALQISSDKEYEEPCRRCRPDTCSKEETIYWRYDSKRQTPSVLSSTVPQLQSIPSTGRIDEIHNLATFFKDPKHVVPPARYLFDYNPSIVILPSNFDKARFSKEDTPIYLASFRVSTQQSCFHPTETKAMYGGSWDRKPAIEDYLALALLRADRSIICDVVVDVKASGVFQHFAEDFRLFVFDDVIYVASFDLIAPLLISYTLEVRSTNQAVKDGYVPLTKLFPSKLSISLRAFPSCPVCLNRPGKRCGKNFNYFSTAPHKVWVELWPTGPHLVQRVNLDQACSVSRSTTEESALEVYSDVDYRPPLPAWYTMEEVMFPSMLQSEALLTRGRGGACCISIENPVTGDDLLVGTYHTKIPRFGKRSGKRLPLWRQPNGNATKVATNQYLSRWYAFKPTPPFPVVAQSGQFCLGFPDEQEQKEHPLIQTTLWKKMIFGGDGLGETPEESSLILDCPRIHFVSGMTVKAEDPSKVLVAYGVNDCASRLVEFEKEAIFRALFPSKT